MLKLCILLLIIVSITTSKCNGGFEEHFYCTVMICTWKIPRIRQSTWNSRFCLILIAYGKVVEGRPHVKWKCCLSLGANLHKNLLVVLVKVPSSRLDKGDCRNRSRKQQRSDSTQNNSPNKKINFPAIPIKMCLWKMLKTRKTPKQNAKKYRHDE